MILLRTVWVLMIMSGIAGVAVGDQSAQAGWWLIVVFGTGPVLTLAGERRGAPRAR